LVRVSKGIFNGQTFFKVPRGLSKLIISYENLSSKDKATL